jgi:dUTP pyrophosphatase
MKVKVWRKNESVPLPVYMSEGASGMDLYACLEEPLLLSPGTHMTVPTGLFLAIPDGYEAQIRPRSGLAHRHGVTVLNAPGTVDADYRGEVKVILINHGERSVEIAHGMRVAQMVLARVERVELCEAASADELEGTDREDGGFGHTGL